MLCFHHIVFLFHVYFHSYFKKRERETKIGIVTYYDTQQELGKKKKKKKKKGVRIAFVCLPVLAGFESVLFEVQ
jgi:hypothetical protein